MWTKEALEMAHYVNRRPENMQEIIITFKTKGDYWIMRKWMVLFSSVTLPICPFTKVHTTVITILFCITELWLSLTVKRKYGDTQRQDINWKGQITDHTHRLTGFHWPISQPQICTRLPHLFHPIPALLFSFLWCKPALRTVLDFPIDTGVNVEKQAWEWATWGWKGQKGTPMTE